VDNPDSWLDLSDLVFVDPVGTGYSGAAGNAAKSYWGVAEDLASIATFIDRYLTQNHRQASPKYLVGESYGGFRAARLPELLADDHNIAIAGSFLISPVLEFSLIDGNSLALLPDVLRLPSYAAVALERSAAPTPEALGEVEQFALGPYLTALAATPRNEAAMLDIYGKVARYTGVPEPVVARHDGRIPLGVFVKEARRPDKLLISRYDGSVTAPDPHPDSERARGDALFDGLRAVLTKGMTDYLSDTLGVRTDLPYRLLNRDAVRQWNWRSGLGGREGHVGAADALREVLANNRTFKVVIAHGVTDLVAPYLTSRYVVDHLPRTLTADRVTLNLYPGGHMMYLRPGSRARLHADAARLYSPSP
jgi:carboxypeptidase C (cathepsin A)